MKNHACQYPGCGKRFTRAEHLRRHALNHEQPRNGFTCERCSVHFQRPDLLGEGSHRGLRIMDRGLVLINVQLDI